MSSVGTTALTECMNETAKVIEEFQAVCLLLANDFSNLRSQAYPGTRSYPTFTKKNKKKHKPTKPEYPTETSLENTHLIENLIHFLAKKTGKSYDFVLIQKIKCLYDISNESIRNNIVRLIAKENIEFFDQIDILDQNNSQKLENQLNNIMENQKSTANKS